MPSRRTFLKHSCLLCSGLTTAVLTQLTSCASTLPVYNLKFSGNTLTVPVINFEESDMAIVRDAQAAYDILLVRQSPLQYDAIYMRCTHGSYAVGTTNDGIACPAHGSIFDYDGTVRTGPATEPLLRFPTELDNNNGIVTINIQALKI
ncbi:MAG TPA: Rieske 2Fe-2S domain-containing protein [Cyclobacteriaceae bacterium]|nr:Rieske 2Fe-2S domain-containing protein [Cyclobacteriaceae bacterium]